MPTKPEPVRLVIKTPIDQIMNALQNGHRVWGGGVGMQRTANGTAYRLDTVSERGTAKRRYIENSYQAALALLTAVGGNAVLTIEPLPV